MQTADEWIRENEKLAIAFVARKWGAYKRADAGVAKVGVTYDDLRAAALWGMWDAWERWSPDGGASVASYAHWWMRARCQMIVRDNASQLYLRPKSYKRKNATGGMRRESLSRSLNTGGGDSPGDRTLEDVLPDPGARGGDVWAEDRDDSLRARAVRRAVARAEAARLLARERVADRAKAPNVVGPEVTMVVAHARRQCIPPGSLAPLAGCTREAINQERRKLDELVRGYMRGWHRG